MKVAFDTNAIINLCDNDSWTQELVKFLENDADKEVYLVSTVSDELNIDSLNNSQKENYSLLESAMVKDSQRYFTIGVSHIGGNDVLRGDGAARIGIQRIVVDMQAAYARYRRQSF